jgi:hypothetical protein
MIEGRVRVWETELDEMRSKRLDTQKENRLLRMLLRNSTETLEGLAEKNNLLLAK